MLQFRATAVLRASSYARRFITGNEPGMPMHTGQVWVFGSAPNRVLQRQNSLLSVASWTCTSRPMTVVYSDIGEWPQKGTKGAKKDEGSLGLEITYSFVPLVPSCGYHYSAFASSCASWWLVRTCGRRGEGVLLLMAGPAVAGQWEGGWFV